MLYKAHILEINVSALVSASVSRHAAILTLTGKLETVMLSWSLRDRTTRAASMSCLEQVVAKIESKHGKCYENLYVWRDEMGVQFRSHFVFKLLAGTILPNKWLMWFYNKHQHGKGPMDGVGDQ